ncbi:MAG: Uma2 family endonuclease [Deltaproteobacteria bacterium]|nr:Uma2 family endonuclease [Deltaproteobacteria bacterium]
MTNALPPISEKVFDGGKLPAQGEWTYEDYRKLPDDGWRYEVIQGVLHMTPAPRTRHQEVLANLVDLIRPYVKGRRLGKVLFAPTDVVLPTGLGAPVHPDLFFVATEHLSSIGENFVEGAPTLIAEVLSPSNWIDDRRDKYIAYAQAGVQEYWIVDPGTESVEVFVLRGSSYELLGLFSHQDDVRSEVLEDLRASILEIFEQ